MTDVPKVDPDYDREALRQDRERAIYNSQKTSRPAYTREDPSGTTREDQRNGYDKVTFPILRSNQVARLDANELGNEAGTLWRLRRWINDEQFAFLRAAIARGEHMVTDFEVTLVLTLEASTLTNKANVIKKVPKTATQTIPMLLPNGDFHYGGY